MSQQTFNKLILLALVLVGAFHAFRFLAAKEVSFMSTHIPMWGTALIVIASGLVMYKLTTLARKESQNRTLK